MKSHQILLGAFGLGLCLTGAAVLWPGERTAPPVTLTQKLAQAVRATWKPVQEDQSGYEHPGVAKKSDSPSWVNSLHLVSIGTALEKLEAEPDSMKRDELIQAFVNRLAPGELACAPAFLQSKAQSEANKALELSLVRKWAGNDPLAAADWTSRLPVGGIRQEAINDVAIAWANQDLPKAIKWAEQLPEGEDRQGALFNTAYEAARTNPREALTVAAELKEDPARDDLLKHAAMQWAETEPGEAAIWAKQIDDGLLRQRVLSAIATAWADSDPVAAANLAVHLAPGRPQDDAIIGIVQRWAQSEPKAATEWVNGFPEGQLRRTAFGILASTAPTVAAHQ